MKDLLLNLVKIIAGLYLLLCIALYFFQEKMIFLPQKLSKDYKFDFPQSFEELNFQAPDGKILNGLLFKVAKPKGLVFYLHGNAGSLSSWGEVADIYMRLGHDVFILDYRSYGKSEGEISSQGQLFKDNQMVYDALKESYDEHDISIVGYSIGTGLASKLASENHPKQLILQAPYYSLTDMMGKMFPYIPTILLKYKFATNKYLEDCQMPITIFHGNKDELIPYESSLKLQEKFGDKIHLIELKGQGHNGITENKVYGEEIRMILQ